MDETQKQKFRELAKLSKEKEVPEGWVYVGFGTGNNTQLGFGRSLRMQRNIMSGENDWSYPVDSYKGDSPKNEYAAPQDIWNKVIGPDTQELIAFSKQSFLMAAPAETVYIGPVPVGPCFEFTEGHYCMDRREWEARFGEFKQTLPEKFSIRCYWPDIDEGVREHLMTLGYGFPRGLPDNFIYWNGNQLTYEQKSDLIPLPLEVLFTGEELHRIQIDNLIIRGDNVWLDGNSFSLSNFINKLKEHYDI